MKETGIIMSGDHPRLILDGLKTMTRRTYGLESVNKDPDRWEYKWYPPLRQHEFYDKLCNIPPLVVKCPYGQVGDMLWVKEAWRIESFVDGEPLLFSYRDGETMEENEYSDTPNYEDWYERVCIQSTEDAERAFQQGLVRRDEGGNYRWDMGKSPCSWRTPLFMPKWASRIWREVTGLRAERLQEITLADCLKEGIEQDTTMPNWHFPTRWNFIDLWDSLNAKRGQNHIWEDDEGNIHREFIKGNNSWESNPWVWVIEFKGIETGAHTQ